MLNSVITKEFMDFEIVEGIVVKGFITRYAGEEEWPAKLVKLPLGAFLQDGDAIPYYLQDPENGKFYEYYPYYAPDGMHAYVEEENFVEEYFNNK